MSKYTITPEDITEFLSNLGCGQIANQSTFFNYLQKMINADKWSSTDLECLDDAINNNLGSPLRVLFVEKANHPLFRQYYLDSQIQTSETPLLRRRAIKSSAIINTL
jgi:RNAse (barnase) inhibitor barstar